MSSLISHLYCLLANNTDLKSKKKKKEEEETKKKKNPQSMRKDLLPLLQVFPVSLKAESTLKDGSRSPCFHRLIYKCNLYKFTKGKYTIPIVKTSVSLT